MFQHSNLTSSETFGAVVTGLRRTDLNEPTVRQHLYDLWIDRGLLLFRECDADSETQLELSRVFGPLRIHPLAFSVSNKIPEMTNALHEPETGTIYEVDGVEWGAWQPWHTDTIYTKTLNRGGILRPLQLSKEGGLTCFIDKADAYESLPSDVKAAIEGLYVVYQYRADASKSLIPRDGRVKLVRLDPGSAKGRATNEAMPSVAHPMVIEHERPGRRMLNISARFATHIHGMRNEAGDSLLERVIRHATEDMPIYAHEWEQDDMLLWDNWRVMHSVTGIAPNVRRHMQRTTIMGDYTLGRFESEMTLNAEPVNAGL